MQVISRFFRLIFSGIYKTVQKDAIHLNQLFKKLVKYFYSYVMVDKIALREKISKMEQNIIFTFIILIIR